MVICRSGPIYLAQIPYSVGSCNSNWAMRCSLKKRGLTSLTPPAKPTGGETCCKRSEDVEIDVPNDTQ